MRPGACALAVALMCGGCDAQILDRAGANAVGPDASPGLIDASPGPDSIDASPGPDAMPVATCSRRSVYLNFEGQALKRGRSDATLNQAEWMTIAEGTAPRYLAGNVDRLATIKAIEDGVRAQLARFPIQVVTTRPATGNYVMVVFGGRAAAVGSPFSGAVNRLDCDDSRPNDVAWISDLVSPVQAVVNYTIGAIGLGLGLSATLDPNDCMCGWGNDCESLDLTPCSLGSPIARDPAAAPTCPGALAQQDEVATIRAAFCQ